MLNNRFVRILFCGAALGFIACYLLLDKMSNLTDLKMMPWSEFAQDADRVDKFVAHYNASHIRPLGSMAETRAAYEARAQKATAAGKSPMFDRANARVEQLRAWWVRVYQVMTLNLAEERPGRTAPKPRAVAPAKAPAVANPSGIYLTLAALTALIVATTCAKNWAWRKSRL